MSVISAMHNVVGYVSGVTKPFAGQRLASFNWKTSKTGDNAGSKRDSKAVSLPRIGAEVVVENVVVLAPVIAAYLESVQDKIVREMLDKNAGLSVISDADISLAACIEYLEDSGESGRITKKDVEEWFDGKIADNLMVLLADKLGIGEVASENDLLKMGQMIAAFKGKVSGLAGGKTSYDPKTAAQVLKAVSLADDGDVLKERFSMRLEKMMVVKADDLLDAL